MIKIPLDETRVFECTHVTKEPAFGRENWIFDSLNRNQKAVCCKGCFSDNRKMFLFHQKVIMGTNSGKNKICGNLQSVIIHINLVNVGKMCDRKTTGLKSLSGIK